MLGSEFLNTIGRHLLAGVALPERSATAEVDQMGTAPGILDRLKQRQQWDHVECRVAWKICVRRNRTVRVSEVNDRLETAGKNRAVMQRAKIAVRGLYISQAAPVGRGKTANDRANRAREPPLQVADELGANHSLTSCQAQAHLPPVTESTSSVLRFAPP